jgi:hypothetical protein
MLGVELGISQEGRFRCSRRRRVGLEVAALADWVTILIRTMEDTHAFLYNFLHTPAPVLGMESGS